MKTRTIYCCFLGVLWCWTSGYPETYHRFADKNGVICVSNSFSDESFPKRGGSETGNLASAEVQRAREQAQIEYWRAVEAKARSLRNTPDTEVHRKRRSSLQEDDLSFPTTASRKELRRQESGKRGAGASFDLESFPGSADSKKGRSWKTSLQSRKNTPESALQKKKRRSSRGGKVALR